MLAACAASLIAADRPAAAEVEHRQPVLTSVFPQGSQPGQRTRVEILGQHLDGAERLVFRGTGVSGNLIEVESTRLVAEFTSASGAALGPHYFRVVSPRGASNLSLFRVGAQPHHLEREPNSSMDRAELVALPVTINGRLEVDEDFDFFRFRAAAGKTLIFDLRAARNGSSLDAALILLDWRGRKLEHREDTFIWDPFFAHRFADTGDYYAVVQPTHTRNDPGFAYQLNIWRDAYLETVNPIALTPGTETQVTFYGQGLVSREAAITFDSSGFSAELLNANGTSATARLKVPPGARGGVHRLAVGGSNWASFLVDPAPVHRGGELISSFPASITGTARYREPERFDLQVVAAQALVLRYGRNAPDRPSIRCCVSSTKRAKCLPATTTVSSPASLSTRIPGSNTDSSKRERTSLRCAISGPLPGRILLTKYPSGRRSRALNSS